MTVLIDTGVLYADHDRDATRHEVADRALTSVYRGAFGQPYLTDYIFDEAITVTLARTGSHGPAVSLSHRLRGVGDYPPVFEILRVNRATFDDANEFFERYDDQGLSFTDATTVAAMKRRGIDHVLSFDTDFDGLVDRLDPADVAEY